MGQSASRNRPQSTPSPSAPPHQSHPQAESTPSSSTRGSATVGSTKRSRRSSLRRNLLGLLPQSRSSSSLRSSPSTSSETTQPPKKRWRSSQRWSRFPKPEARHDAPESVSEAAEDEAGEATAVTQHPCTPIPHTASRNEPSAEEHTPDMTDEERRLSQNIGAWLSGTAAASRPQEHPSPPEVGQYLPDLPNTLEESGREYASAEADYVNLPPQTVSGTPDLATPPDTATPPVRHYQPPGPLVVVQGVVNTTDAPPTPRTPTSNSLRPSRSTTPRPSSTNRSSSLRRSASTTTPRESDRQAARSRLSSLITRSRPSSYIRPESTSNRNSAISSDLSSNMSHDTVSVEENPESSESDEVVHEDDSRPRPLSPGSIDVLGTLLSVAAAATAASLFSSNLTFPGANLGANMPNRPMSPTPTAGLGNFQGLGNLAGLGLDPAGLNSGQANGAAQAQREGRDRVRNVWESVRDRLGLQPRSSSATDSGTTGASDAHMQPGEMMLAEMARALNVGLGLNGDGMQRNADQAGGGNEHTSAGDGTNSSNTNPSSSPPEDSFERFLLNLQADLRTALSEDGSERDQGVRSSTSFLLTQPEQEVVSPSGTYSDDQRDHEGLTEDVEVEDDQALPFTEMDSDSEDQDEDGGDSEDDDMDVTGRPRSPRAPTPLPAGGSPFGGDRHHTIHDERRPPGINLWRVYRFQPVLASQTQSHAVGASSASELSPDAVPSAASVTAHSPASGSSTQSTSISDDTSSERPDSPSTFAPSPSSDPTANFVVPVIVVGLQSVDMPRTHDHPNVHHDEESVEDASSMSSSVPSGNRRHSMSTLPTENGSQSRGRSWQSRAANALRTLRPGRRGVSSNRPPADAPGARTFLIYVIGGYYPPNHHMVTGSDSLESYEALWELAELLGQVKPPVASKEDIENSGLVVVNMSELPQYEQEGKVASNCIERCLICLDEYEAEDQLRLMTCKHAFHKECVDKWLQVGRNNCPACRTKGVFTAGDQPNPSA